MKIEKRQVAEDMCNIVGKIDTTINDYLTDDEVVYISKFIDRYEKNLSIGDTIVFPYWFDYEEFDLAEGQIEEIDFSHEVRHTYSIKLQGHKDKYKDIKCYHIIKIEEND